MNINDYVWIKLTPEGEKLLEDKKYKWWNKRDSGWSVWYLWELMSIFGEHTYLGNPIVYFDYSDIRFTDPNK